MTLYLQATQDNRWVWWLIAKNSVEMAKSCRAYVHRYQALEAARSFINPALAVQVRYRDGDMVVSGPLS